MMKAVPGFSGAAISREIARCIRNDPRLASYDFVMDVRESDTGSTIEDFKLVLESYNQVRRDPGLKYGCYVSSSPNFILWATAMADLFGDRACPVFTTPEDAHSFLDRARGDVPA